MVGAVVHYGLQTVEGTVDAHRVVLTPVAAMVTAVSSSWTMAELMKPVQTATVGSVAVEFRPTVTLQLFLPDGTTRAVQHIRHADELAPNQWSWPSL